MEYPSKLVEEAVGEFMKLPGIGKKTALRLVLSLVKKKQEDTRQFGNTLIKLSTDIKHCTTCFNLSDSGTCNICSKPSRDKGLVCVVEDIRDVMAIENTQQYSGVYHVLNGLVSPMDGIGPDDLTINELIERVQNGEVRELIFALSATMEGDTTMFYIARKTREHGVSISTLARGISIGGRT